MPVSKDISMVLNKMKKKVQLNDVDFDVMGNFLSQNRDESRSEEAGYYLFEYLEGNKSANETYISFLNKKGKPYKEKILEKLVRIMCIDLGEANYTYEKLKNNFSLFKESNSAQKAFETCLNNRVE